MEFSVCQPRTGHRLFLFSLYLVLFLCYTSLNSSVQSHDFSVYPSFLYLIHILSPLVSQVKLICIVHFTFTHHSLTEVTLFVYKAVMLDQSRFRQYGDLTMNDFRNVLLDLDLTVLCLFCFADI